MDEAIKLLRIIGSPFSVEPGESPADDGEAAGLFTLAVKNKIGLYYLDVLQKRGRLGSLVDEYRSGYARFLGTQETAARISQALTTLDTRHAIYKFVKAYPTTPSDVDVLLLCQPEIYRKAIELLVAGSYHKIAETPSQVAVYDLRDGELKGRDVHRKEGGIYYIDLYKEAAASHICYMDKARLDPYVTSMEVRGKKLMALSAPADLAVTLIHSVFPEQLYTLGDFYTTTSALAAMGKEEVGQLLNMVRENHIRLAVGSSLGITAALHQAAFGAIPPVIKTILDGLGDKAAQQLPVLPYRYSPGLVSRVLLEKMGERKAALSILRQCLAMANPRTARAVLAEIVMRRARETY